jgi:hypothetical protein
MQKMIRPRLELRTFCVLDRCDNQLRHRTDESKFYDTYLIVCDLLIFGHYK